jgi:hypothetical protein
LVLVTGALAATDGHDAASFEGTAAVTGALAASETGADVCDITDRIQKQYPLAGVEQAYPGVGTNVYPIAAAQTYPAIGQPTYPLAGTEQTYPLRRAA